MHHHMTLNDRNGNNESHIPEPAIWHIFESLIKAGLVMERGFANRRDERPDRGWQDIVHLDIKPDNVFIGDYPTDNPNKRSENFAMYPTFKLGDFGTSIFRRRKENTPTMPMHTGAEERRTTTLLSNGPSIMAKSIKAKNTHP
jgi:serine/threonine protein kinase